MIILILFLWLIAFAKRLFFWLWLWQLKEYHTGRFIDHFRTVKGRKLIFNPLLLLEAALLIVICFYPNPVIAYIIIAVFFAEFLSAIRDFLNKTLRIPVLTRKTSVILSAGISLELLVVSLLYEIRIPLAKSAAILLGFDLFVPVVATILVMAFQPLAVAMRDQLLRKATAKIQEAKDLMVVGVTGSYGKTSTKEFLATMLSKKYKVLKTSEHQNSEVGISNCVVEKLEDDHEIFVVEMGAYNRGGIKMLADIVRPKIGILTGINEQHMATFGSLQNTIQAKFELIGSLPEDGLGILNYDDQNVKKQKVEDFNAKLKNVKFFSMSDREADMWAEDVKVEQKSLSFKLKTNDGDGAEFDLNLLGAHNIYNILGAAVCAKHLGMSLAEISDACAEVDPKQSGFQLKEGINNLNILDATYSSNPTGIMSHLDYLKLWPDSKKIIIMPCLIELGKASKDVHRKIGEKMAGICDLLILTSKDRLKEINEGVALGAKGKKTEVVFIDNPAKILDKVKEFADPNDIVLLESRVPGSVKRGLSKEVQ